jgi:hypothetical protein
MFHIGIRRLQIILLKIALICGVRVLCPYTFDKLLAPLSEDENWRCSTLPELPENEILNFNVLLSADGENSILSR